MREPVCLEPPGSSLSPTPIQDHLKDPGASGREISSSHLRLSFDTKYFQGIFLLAVLVITTLFSVCTFDVTEPFRPMITFILAVIIVAILLRSIGFIYRI